MKRFLIALSIGILTVTTGQGLSMAQTAESSGSKAQDIKFEVLSPWADADPIPVRGISPRVKSLAGKKIGLFVNSKRAAMPIAQSIDKRLKNIYPDIQTIVFHSIEPNVNEIETKNKEKFTAWVKSVDAVIAVVGD
ncbi:hypothetical protein ACFL6W_01695 [Thermodesulfobacteriota bacterium]